MVEQAVDLPVMLSAMRFVWHPCDIMWEKKGIQNLSCFCHMNSFSVKLKLWEKVKNIILYCKNAMMWARELICKEMLLFLAAKHVTTIN